MEVVLHRTGRDRHLVGDARHLLHHLLSVLVLGDRRHDEASLVVLHDRAVCVEVLPGAALARRETHTAALTERLGRTPRILVVGGNERQRRHHPKFEALAAEWRFDGEWLETTVLRGEPVPGAELDGPAPDGVITSGLLVDGTLYLQTSPESFMKRLLAAGYPDIYSICRVFRGSEAGRLHQPEFTMVEWYRHGFGLRAMIDETIAFIAHILGRPALLEAESFEYETAFRHFANIDPFAASSDELAEAAAADAGLRADLVELDVVSSQGCRPGGLQPGGAGTDDEYLFFPGSSGHRRLCRYGSRCRYRLRLK